MPPKLALILCTVFVLFLLRIDYKQKLKMSWALWIPTIWMLIIVSKPLGVWFPFTSRVEDVTTSPLDQMAQLILLSLGLFVLIRRNLNWSGVIRSNGWLILLVVYMFLSIFWSDMLFVCFKRWIRELIAVIMALVVLTEQNPKQATQSILRRTVYVLIPFSILLIKYYPEYGRMYHRWTGEIMWIGVTMQKNGLGRLCMISAFFLIWTLLKRWQGREIAIVRYQTYVELFVLILTVTLMFGPTIQAYSATAVMALMVGLVTFTLLLWMKNNRIDTSSIPFDLVLAIIILLGTFSVFVGGSTVAGLTSALGRDDTLTGRTEVWANLLPVAMQRIFLGHGFGGFWTNITRMNYDISEAHSGYLDVLLETGFLGLLLISIFLLSSCRKAQNRKTYDFNWGSLWICFLLMAAVHNITETSLNSLTSPLTAILMFMAVSSSIIIAIPHEIYEKYYHQLQNRSQ